MQIKADEISKIIEEEIQNYDQRVEMSETGTVLYIGDGIARVYGVQNAMQFELLEFPGGIMGMVLNLEEDNVGVALLGSDMGIKEGDTVKRTGKIFSVPVGDKVMGRVLNPLGQPIDGLGPVESTETRAVEIKAPGVSDSKRYVKSVKLNESPEAGSDIRLRIVAYEPETYYSAGSVVLNTTAS